MNLQINIREANEIQQLLTEQKFEEAVIAYRLIIELDVHNSEAYYGLAECLTQLGQLEEAISAYRQAFQLIQSKKNF